MHVHTKQQEALHTHMLPVQNNLPISVCSGKTNQNKIAKKIIVFHNEADIIQLFFPTWMKWKQSYLVIRCIFQDKSKETPRKLYQTIYSSEGKSLIVKLFSHTQYDCMISNEKEQKKSSAIFCLFVYISEIKNTFLLFPQFHVAVFCESKACLQKKYKSLLSSHDLLSIRTSYF